MTGQWPVEASPVVADLSHSGRPEILVLNRGGQLMLWAADGTAIAPGQDGLVRQLPAGRWTTAPTLVETPEGARLLAASVEGLVVGLDAKFELLWRHQLAGETGWGRAMPARLRIKDGSAFVFGDATGTVTCLKPTGVVLWTNALGAGPIKAPLLQIAFNPADEGVLAAAGSTLFSLDATGKTRWRRDLGKEILTRPEILSLPDRKIILCGTDSGLLFALNLQGQIVWECPTGDTLNNSIAFLPRTNAAPLILCPGLWGNLHAIDIEGHHAWSHLFRAKTRATPLVLDSYGDGRQQIYLPTFHQHVYVFDENGGLSDDLHLSGILPSALTPVVDSSGGRPDLLVTSTTLLGYRLRPGPPRSPYGETGEPQEVGLLPPSAEEDPEVASLRVRNPRGALINVRLSMTDTNGWTRIASRLTARSAFEIPLPALVRTGVWSLRATARDAAGHLLDEKTWKHTLVSAPGG